MYLLRIAVAMGLLSCNVCEAAQKSAAQKPPAQQNEPKPADKGPSLDRTVAFLNEITSKTGEKIALQMTAQNGGAGTGNTGTASFSAAGCTFTWGGTQHSFKDVKKVSVKDYVLWLNNMAARGGEPAEAQIASIVPAVSVLLIKMRSGDGYTSTQTFNGNAYSVTDAELHLNFLEQDDADRAAKAMNHAAELCGAGADDPF